MIFGPSIISPEELGGRISAREWSENAKESDTSDWITLRSIIDRRDDESRFEMAYKMMNDYKVMQSADTIILVVGDLLLNNWPFSGEYSIRKNIKSLKNCAEFLNLVSYWIESVRYPDAKENLLKIQQPLLRRTVDFLSSYGTERDECYEEELERHFDNRDGRRRFANTATGADLRGLSRDEQKRFKMATSSVMYILDIIERTEDLSKEAVAELYKLYNSGIYKKLDEYSKERIVDLIEETTPRGGS